MIADPAHRFEREMDQGLAEILTRRATDPVLPLEAVEHEERRDRVQAILDRLPERDRLLLRIVHLEGGSYAEVARILGVSSNSVGSLLERAKLRFRTLAAGHAPDLTGSRD